MDVYLYVNPDGSISGYSMYQPDGYHFPLVHIPEDIKDEFEASWMYFTYKNEQLVAPMNHEDFAAADVKINKRLDIVQQQQAFTSQQLLDQDQRLKAVEAKLEAK